MDGNYSRITTRYEMDASEKAKCPYCGNIFTSENARCPNCGAGISRLGNKIVITKTEEQGENERIAEFKPAEEMQKYKEKKRQDKVRFIRFGLLMLLPLIGLLIEKIIKALTK